MVIQRDIPDRLWYDAVPELLVDVRGEGVDELIKNRQGCKKLSRNTYSVWPGPNSNTFIAWIGRIVPELRLDLPPTAIGKDWLGRIKFFHPPEWHRVSVFSFRSFWYFNRSGRRVRN